MLNRYYLDVAEDGRIVGRFDAVINSKDIPAHAKLVTRKVFEQTLIRQPGTAYLTPTGKVEFRSIDVLSAEDRAALHERMWRDSEVESIKWLRERHRDEMDLALDPTLNADQFKSVLTYLQALRDWPQSPGFPAPEQRPAPPDWLTAHTQ